VHNGGFIYKNHKQEHMLLHTRQSSIENNKYKCRINTVVSPDDGHIVA